MCRLFVYQGIETNMYDLLVRPGHSLLKQSFQSNERSYAVNADGFGVAWYKDIISMEPAVFREITPAWSNRNLQEISKLIRTKRIFAHVRAASHGIPVNETNCHPFKYKNMLWMHNGKIGNFNAIRRQMEQFLSEEAYQMIQGSTDSEYAFSLFIHYLLEEGDKAYYDISEYLHALVQMIYKIRELNSKLDQHNALNFSFTDGKNTLITRYSDSGEKNPPSLYYSTGKSLEYVDERLRIQKSDEPEFIIIASEPLNSQTEVWNEIPENSLMVINEQLNFHFITLEEHVRMDTL